MANKDSYATASLPSSIGHAVAGFPSEPFSPLPIMSGYNMAFLAQVQGTIDEVPSKMVSEWSRTNHSGVAPKLTLDRFLSCKPIVNAYSAKGIFKLYPWQASAIACGQDGSNLVYCAPTSGGKSVVSEVLMLRQLLSRGVGSSSSGGHSRRAAVEARALLVLPYVSIVSEKAADLAKVMAPLKLRVKGYSGAETSAPFQDPKEVLAVCTIEKANMTINRMVEEQRLHELCCVVVDEVHMVADPNRGLVLELCLTKLMRSIALGESRAQVVCMSATMAGLDALCSWLNARLFMTNFRPVPLTEHAVFNGVVYKKLTRKEIHEQGPNTCPLQEERALPALHPKDKDRLLPLLLEPVSENHSVLIFCATRAACQSCAALVAELLPPLLPPPSPEILARRAAAVEALTEALAGCRNQELEKLLNAGVAYHHAGLTSQERAVVEASFRNGATCVLAATSTLAAGINLPARRVILRSLRQGLGPVGRAQYLQMIGRAGRAGQSEIGESFIMGRGAAHSGQGEWGEIERLMHAPLPHIVSQLMSRKSGGKVESSAAKVPNPVSGTGVLQPRPVAAQNAQMTSRAPSTGAIEPKPSSGQLTLLDKEEQVQVQHMLLEAIANGSADSGGSIEMLLKSTLQWHQTGYQALHAATKAALTALRSQKLVTLRASEPKGGERGRRKSAGKSPAKVEVKWEVTSMGRAVYASALPTALGVELYLRLKSGQDRLVLGSPLHLIYLIILDHPFEIFSWSDWSRVYDSLPAVHRQVATVEEISYAYIMRMISAGRGTPAEAAKHARFAAACALYALVCEGDVLELEDVWGKPNCITKQGVTRGQLQKMQADLAKWAAMAGALCGAAGWWGMEALLGALAAQAAAGVRPELLQLMQVPAMTGAHARALYDKGIISPDALAAASEEDVARIILESLTRSLRNRSKKLAEKGLLEGQQLNVMLANRAARTLMESTRQFVLDTAAQHAAEDEHEMDVDAKADGDKVSGLSDTMVVQGLQFNRASGAEVQATRQMAVERAASSTPLSTSTLSHTLSANTARGTCHIMVLNARSEKAKAEHLIREWLAQSAFSFSLVCEEQPGALEQSSLGTLSCTEHALLVAADKENISHNANCVSFKDAKDGGVLSGGVKGTLEGGRCTGERNDATNRTALVPRVITGVAVCWGSHSVLYFDLNPSDSFAHSGEQYQSAPPRLGESIATSGCEQPPQQQKPVEGNAAKRLKMDPLASNRMNVENESEPIATIPAESIAVSGYRQPVLQSLSAKDERVQGLKRDPLVAAPHSEVATVPNHSGGISRYGQPSLQSLSAEGEPAKTLKLERSVADSKNVPHNSTPFHTADPEREKRSIWWPVIREAFCNLNTSVICNDSITHLAVLLNAGLKISRAALEDPSLAYELLHPDKAGASLRAIQQQVLPQHQVRVPLQFSSNATEACRSALLSFALSQPLKCMLHKEDLWDFYRNIRLPLAYELASAACGGSSSPLTHIPHTKATLVTHTSSAPAELLPRPCAPSSLPCASAADAPSVAPSHHASCSAPFSSLPCSDACHPSIPHCWQLLQELMQLLHSTCESLDVVAGQHIDFSSASSASQTAVYQKLRVIPVQQHGSESGSSRSEAEPTEFQPLSGLLFKQYTLARLCARLLTQRSHLHYHTSHISTLVPQAKTSSEDTHCPTNGNVSLPPRPLQPSTGTSRSPSMDTSTVTRVHCRAQGPIASLEVVSSTPAGCVRPRSCSAAGSCAFLSLACCTSGTPSIQDIIRNVGQQHVEAVCPQHVVFSVKAARPKSMGAMGSDDRRQGIIGMKLLKSSVCHGVLLALHADTAAKLILDDDHKMHRQPAQVTGHVRFRHPECATLQDLIVPADQIWSMLSACDLGSRIRPALHGTHASATGRESSDSANILTNGKLTEVSFALPLEHPIVPVCGRMRLLSVEYQHLHLSMLAHVSRDDGLLAAAVAYDPWEAAASFWQDCPEARLSETLAKHSIRSEPAILAYQLVEAICLGEGPKGMAHRMKVSRETAAQVLTSFQLCFTAIGDLRERVGSSIRQQGYVQSIAGRKFWFGPVGPRTPPAVLTRTIRAALSALLLASAADLMSVAVVTAISTIRSFGTAPDDQQAHTPAAIVPESVTTSHDLSGTSQDQRRRPCRCTEGTVSAPQASSQCGHVPECCRLVMCSQHRFVLLVPDGLSLVRNSDGRDFKTLIHPALSSQVASKLQFQAPLCIDLSIGASMDPLFHSLNK